MMLDVEEANQTVVRSRRESSFERRPCAARFQFELLLIPLGISVIPLSICGFLLCACCGPKEERAKLPERMWCCRLNQTRPRNRTDTESSLSYGPGYVKRNNSKKTRFSTNVLGLFSFDAAC
ncbi:hypothetical protein M3Y99_00201200 [Aphelenchoides fujianensis]|nr:hypothetical protein M3Y99_00201200 [Aphelenchoides fujianensis]